MNKPHIIIGNDCEQSWKFAVSFLLKKKKKETFNLLVHVNQANIFNKDWINLYNPQKITSEAKDIRFTINTIFPWKQHEKGNSREDIYKMYKKAMNRTKNKQRWGTYFLRFIEYGSAKTNQLEEIILNIENSKNIYKTTNHMHVTNINLDSIRRTRGQPCLQYVQLLRNNNVLNLLAVYRSQEYSSKALGNFIGLSKLLNFICSETSLAVGSITCHAAYANISVSKEKMNSLILQK